VIKPWLVRVVYRLQVWWWWLTRPTTSGVKSLVFCGDSILLVRISYGHKRYTLPGGGVKRRESFLAAAKRELYEEAGVVADVTYFGKYQQSIQYKNDTVYCFSGVVTKPVAIPDGGEVVEAQWFSKTQLPSNRVSSVDKIISLYYQNKDSEDK